jgi:hypothetical protein
MQPTGAHFFWGGNKFRRPLPYDEIKTGFPKLEILILRDGILKPTDLLSFASQVLVKLHLGSIAGISHEEFERFLEVSGRSLQDIHIGGILFRKKKSQTEEPALDIFMPSMTQLKELRVGKRLISIASISRRRMPSSFSGTLKLTTRLEIGAGDVSDELKAAIEVTAWTNITLMTANPSILKASNALLRLAESRGISLCIRALP